MKNLVTDEVKPTNSVKMQKAQSWEIEMIGEFLLKLFHQHVLTVSNNFIVLKFCLRAEFNKFLMLDENAQFNLKFKEENGTVSNLGSLLYRTNFLINTPRGSQYYQIRNISLFQYGNKKLKEWDDQRINSNSFVVSTKPKSNTINHTVDTETVGDDDENDPELMECFKISDDAKSYPLEYQGSSFERRDDDFNLSSMGCFICLRNFQSPEQFEEHIEWHGEDSDFESLKNMKKLEKSFFDLTYTLCKDSHYFCFSLSTNEQHVIIEKIIIVKTRSMFYVNNNRVPYAVDESGVEKFFVDSHLFNICVEQPVVIVFRYKSNEAMRVVEQHHFMRGEEFPDVNFSIKANRLPNRVTFQPKISLLQYLPSNEVKLALKQQFSNNTLKNIANEFGKYVDNNKIITSDTMIQVWNLLLQIEDMDAIQKFACLVQRNVKFRCYRDEYSLQLKVKGRIFVENILSQYDEVLIIPEANEAKAGDEEIDWLLSYADSRTEGKKKKIYNGVVERVSNNRIVFLCKKKLSEKISYKVIFRPARLTLRYQYRALQLLDSVPTKLMQRIFFPEVHEDNAQQLPVQDLDLFNPTIADNSEQLQAVRNIANGPCKSAPYIIFGPPGTGKTTTLVEAILQLYKYRPSTKILVTAGSNGACDEIALRLCKVLMSMDDSRAMVRIYAKSNEKRIDNIDEELLEASNMYGAHFYPDITLLHEYRIVICTLSVVGRLATGQFGKDANGVGVFTHTFVDEVAASTATEVMVGIASTISPINHLIMSGDHKQLGPILQSDRAHELGLGLSLMEHLLRQNCYKVDEFGNYNRSIQTRLRRNHRSHKEIVDLYSELYYDNQLISLANPDDVDLASKWHFSPNPQYPIIFHSVFGQSMTGKSSVSLYNDKELEVVMDYVKDLMYFGINGKKIKEADIGIISPYKKQYLRIQEELNSRRMFEIETGSVETFQGKEKPIIIVSFVRSFTNKLGFLDNPRRLNVTLSRAKSLLILIGNPKTLSTSADFNHIIERCRIKNSMVGATLYDDIPLVNGLDKKSETTEKSNIEKDNKSYAKDRFQQRKNKNKANGNNKNTAVKPNAEHKSGKGTNEEPQLGKQMKKRVTPISQQKQRQHFDKFQKLSTNDAHNAASSKKSKDTDVEEVFKSLPKVSSNQKKISTQSFEKLSTSEHYDDFRKMENEIHEKLRKLRIKHPKPTFSNENVKSSSTIEPSGLKSGLTVTPSKFTSSSSSNDVCKATAAFNSDPLASKKETEAPRYASLNVLVTNSCKISVNKMHNISNPMQKEEKSSAQTTVANTHSTTATLKKETESPRNTSIFNAIPSNSSRVSSSVTRPENKSFPLNTPTKGVSSSPLRSANFTQPTNITQGVPASTVYRAQTNRNNEMYSNLYEWRSINFANAAKSQEARKENKSCIIA